MYVPALLCVFVVQARFKWHHASVGQLPRRTRRCVAHASCRSNMEACTSEFVACGTRPAARACRMHTTKVVLTSVRPWCLRPHIAYLRAHHALVLSWWLPCQLTTSIVRLDRVCEASLGTSEFSDLSKHADLSKHVHGLPAMAFASVHHTASACPPSTKPGSSQSVWAPGPHCRT